MVDGGWAGVEGTLSHIIAFLLTLMHPHDSSPVTETLDETLRRKCTPKTFVLCPNTTSNELQLMLSENTNSSDTESSKRPPTANRRPRRVAPTDPQRGRSGALERPCAGENTVAVQFGYGSQTVTVQSDATVTVDRP